ncbi:MAG: EamA/RhaT family transporter, partial [Deltaproteobacteria bacterium]|nr:EamA/RhaT family transporter [Deltaproteobacteria bacterium]
PRAEHVALLAVGATGYGASLALYLLAQRRLGAARTGSIFAVGPFLGALVSFVAGDRASGLGVLAAAPLFALGVWLHARERHAHAHVHAALEHEHAHRHDDGHHDHAHDPPVAGAHSHPHRHERLVHEHAHAPDVHHRHPHGGGRA